MAKADKFVAERRSCVLRLPKGCRCVGELNLSKKIIFCYPSNLPLPDHVDRFVALNRLAEPPGILGSAAWHSHNLQQFLHVAQRKILAQIPPEPH